MNLTIKRSEKYKSNLSSTGSNTKIGDDKKAHTVFTVNLSDYKFGPVIGKSSFLSTLIYSGKYAKTNELVAIKKYDVDIMAVDEIKILQREINILNQLKHPNVVAVLTSFVVGTEIVMIFPLVEYRSCADIITNHFHTGLPEAVIKIILKDVLIALGFIHTKGIIHRAIKASHILIPIDGHAKLSGFRCAYQRNTGVHLSRQKVFEFPPNSEPNLKWLSPDILRQNCNGYDEKSDVYSLGVTICELTNGFVPYFDTKLSAMLLQKMHGSNPLIYDVSTLNKLRDTPDKELVRIFNKYFSNKQISKQLHAFKDLCCIQNSKERPDTSVLVSHSLFSKTDKDRKSFTELIQPALPITEKYFPYCMAGSKQAGNKNLENSPTFSWEF